MWTNEWCFDKTILFSQFHNTDDVKSLHNVVQIDLFLQIRTFFMRTFLLDSPRRCRVSNVDDVTIGFVRESWRHKRVYVSLWRHNVGDSRSLQYFDVDFLINSEQ